MQLPINKFDSLENTKKNEHKISSRNSFRCYFCRPVFNSHEIAYSSSKIGSTGSGKDSGLLFPLIVPTFSFREKQTPVLMG